MQYEVHIPDSIPEPQITPSNAVLTVANSLEFAVDNPDNQQHQNRDDCNSYNPICSHPAQAMVSKTT